MTRPRYKKISSVLETLFFVALFVWVIFKKGPEWYRDYNWQEKPVTITTPVYSINGDSINLVSSRRRVYVFWATWCGPCTIELSRINDFSKKNPQWKRQILAIAINEDPKTVRKVAEERGYDFPIAIDNQGSVAQQFEIQGTPTILFIEPSDKVVWRTSGISPTLGFRLQRFFESPTLQ